MCVGDTSLSLFPELSNIDFFLSTDLLLFPSSPSSKTDAVAFTSNCLCFFVAVGPGSSPSSCRSRPLLPSSPLSFSLPPPHIRSPTMASTSPITAVVDPGLFLLPLSSFLPLCRLNDASLFFGTAAAVDLHLSSLSSPFFSTNAPDPLHGPSFSISTPTTQEGFRSPMTMAAASLPSSSSPSVSVFLPPSVPPPAFSSPISVPVTSAPVAVSSPSPSSSDPSPSTSSASFTSSRSATASASFSGSFFAGAPSLVYLLPPSTPSFFVVGSRCHHADAADLLHRLPPLLSLLSRLHHRGRSPPRLSSLLATTASTIAFFFHA